MLKKYYVTKAKLDRNKRKHNPIRAGAALALMIGVGGAGSWQSPAEAAPTGGVVVQGEARITAAGGGEGNILITTITQSTPRAVINWQEFNLTATEKVEFITPNNHGATLNHISGATSQILGHITSNGSLYFVNQNGFVFAPEASITAKNLVVATQMLDANRFMGDNNRENQLFNPVTNPNAVIILKGEIKMPNQGVVGIFAPHIEVAVPSAITLRQGMIVLAGGAARRVEIAGDGLLGFALGEMATAVSVKNSGLIQAAGGQVVLTAAGGKNQGGKNLFNARVENNGELRTDQIKDQINDQDINQIKHHDINQIKNQDLNQATDPADGLGGTITLAAINGLAVMGGQGTVKVGVHGSLNYHQDSPTGDIAMDDDFIKRINYHPDMNLDLATGRDIYLTAPLVGNPVGNPSSNPSGLPQNRLSLKAGGSIGIFAAIEVGGFISTSQILRADHLLRLGKGGLNITTTHQNLGPQYFGILLEGEVIAENANISLTSNRGGDIRMEKNITANNLFVLTDGGAIELVGKVDLAYHDETSGLLYLGVKQGGGAIHVAGELSAGIIRIYAEYGDVTFAKSITLKMRDAIPPTGLSGIQGGILAVTSGHASKVRFGREANIVGVTAITRHQPGQDGQMVAVTNFDTQSRPQEINIYSWGNVTLPRFVGVRAGGLLKVYANILECHDLNADNAKIWIMLKYVGHDAFALPYDIDINEHINFGNAQSAYFNTPGVIYVYKPIDAHDLTLRAAAIDFEWNGKIYGQPGGNINLSVKGDTLLVRKHMQYLFNINNVNLALGTDTVLAIDQPIDMGEGKTLSLRGFGIKLNQDITLHGGKLVLNYLSENKKNTFNLDQAIAKHVKFYGPANLSVNSNTNLNITGNFGKLYNGEFTAGNRTTLSINTPMTAQNRLVFNSMGYIKVNQPISVDEGGDGVSFNTRDNNIYLQYGK